MKKDIHDGLHVLGYRPQSSDKVALVNVSKTMEHIDKRWLAIARTDIERGFMAVNRSIFKPERIALVGAPSPVK